LERPVAPAGSREQSSGRDTGPFAILPVHSITMRVFALSDIHVDHEPNQRWLRGLSSWDYRDDILLLAGDVTDSPPLLARSLCLLERRFRRVVFVPGNHELWVVRDPSSSSSFEKLDRVRSLSADCGVAMETISIGGLSVVPLFAWYDYSFGYPSKTLSAVWMDHYACKWPDGICLADVTSQLIALNEPTLDVRNDCVISFSHFVPRMDLIPVSDPSRRYLLHPVLGTTRLERQIRRLRPNIHLYGHSHINGEHWIDGIRYVNNAFGYPYEPSRKRIACIWQD